MERKTLVRLFQNGMRYPTGSYCFWVQRCFEITVHPNHQVEIDEYESFCTEERPAQGSKRFHVGRSVLDKKAGQVAEHAGTGWRTLD